MSRLKYISVCSGIESATVAWEPLGWDPLWFSEIDRFPSAVLAHHYPDVPNIGDMTRFQEWDDARPDVIVGGTPCQSFSIAGLRKGLRDPRGNLMLTYLAIAARYRPQWVVWENVPGVLSSNGGRDFGTFLGALGTLGYGFAYRVLDAQYFHLAQRRERVFVIGCFGDWRSAAAVLFESESLSGNPAPRRKAGEGNAEDVDPSLTASGRGIDRTRDTRGQDPVVACFGGNNGSGKDPYTLAIRKREGTHDLEYRNDGVSNAILTPSGGRLGIGVGAIAHTEILPTMQSGSNTKAGNSARSCYTKDRYIVPVAFAENSRGEVRRCGGDGQVSAQLTTGGGKPGQGRPCVMHEMKVRRLTPRECERLQGFSDDYTLIPYRGRPADRCADSPRYKALGNSMAVPVMRWIGKRIEMVNSIKRKS